MGNKIFITRTIPLITESYYQEYKAEV